MLNFDFRTKRSDFMTGGSIYGLMCGRLPFRPQGSLMEGALRRAVTSMIFDYR